MAARTKGVLETNCPPPKAPSGYQGGSDMCTRFSMCFGKGSDNRLRTRISSSLLRFKGTGGYYHAQRTAPTREPASAGRFFMINTPRLPSSPSHPSATPTVLRHLAFDNGDWRLLSWIEEPLQSMNRGSLEPGKDTHRLSFLLSIQREPMVLIPRLAFNAGN
jgi:hypothetical protein